MNNQFSDVNNRIDQIQAGNSFDASDIYDHLDKHDKQIGVLNNAVANAQDTANTASAKADKAQNTADKAAADVIQSQADANRNITKGIQNNLESQGKAEEKRAGNWFNR